MMVDKSGRVPSGPGSHPSGHAACGVDGASRFDPSRVRLTEAQHSFLLSAQPLPANALHGDRLHQYPPRNNRLGSCVALWRRGIVEGRDPAEGRGPDAWETGRGKVGFVRLTPAGIRLLQYLKGQPDGSSPALR